MRILHLLNHTMRLNGHVHAAVDLACAQVAMGHKAAIASGGGDFDALLAENEVESFRLSHERRPADLTRSLITLHRLMRDWRPDVVHAHMVTSTVMAWPICKLARVPLINTVHNEFAKSAVLMGLGTRVIAVSEAVGRSMERRGVPGPRLSVVLNGTIGSARFKGRDRTPRGLDSPAVVFVGGLHPRKGLPDLLAAFEEVHKRYPDAKMYVVGDGPHREEYMSLANTMACGPAVTFMGAQDEPFPFLLAADVLVLPSHADPAPLVLSEAREAGCAIVATDVDGIPELLEHGQAGMLVPVGDPVALSAAICSLLGNSADLSEWKRKSQFNIERLRVERVVDETLGVYRAAARQVSPKKAELC